MAKLPRYVSGKRYPSARITGVHFSSSKAVIVIGSNENQLRLLLSSDVRLKEAKVVKLELSKLPLSGEWKTFTGKKLSPSEIAAAADLGAYKVIANKASEAFTTLTDAYSSIRNLSVAKVFVDWE